MNPKQKNAVSIDFVAARRRNERSGFSLVELVVVILIIGILAAIASPKIFQVTTKSQAAVELRNARVILDAVCMYKIAEDKYPNDASPGAFPADLSGYLEKSIFTKTSPSGGQYDWDGPAPHAGSERLKIRYPPGTTASSHPIYSILEENDDGSPGSGWITASGRIINFWP